MKHFPRIATLFALCALVGAPLAAQSPDVSGTWNLQMTATLSGEETPCEYQGTIQLSFVDGVWLGPTTLTLVSGPAGCPAEMMASCTGSFDGGTFYGTLDGGKLFGTATVIGTQAAGDQMKGTVKLAPSNPGAKATLAPKTTWQGGMMTDPEGPFAGATGNFVAMRQSALEIPTLTETGLILLAILLMASAIFFLVRNRQQTV